MFRTLLGILALLMLIGIVIVYLFAGILHPPRTPVRVRRVEYELNTILKNVEQMRISIGLWSAIKECNGLDPFSKSKEQYKVRLIGTSVYLYSVGPDGQDDNGTIEYDPTNGEFSKGDIIKEISADNR